MKYYDTSALIGSYPKEFFVTSSIVLSELENIKTAKNKTEDVRFAARQLTHWLFQNQTMYQIDICTTEAYGLLEEKGLPQNNDSLIAASAYLFGTKNGVEIEFITNDIVSGLIAKSYFDLEVIVPDKQGQVKYRGFRTVKLDDEGMAELYLNPTNNQYALNLNEYLVIQNEAGETVDVRKWTTKGLVSLYSKSIQSVEFGDKIKAKDIYQRMVIDSIMTNQVTAIIGQAGSGKTLLALVAAMALIHQGKYDRLVILFNPTSVRGAAQLGYYSGNMIEKALQTNIGNILTSKFGDKYSVETAVKNERIKLVSMADQRGFEVADNEILFITEAQNTSADLLKLCLTRATNCKVILEGDYESQVDNSLFEGNSNGLRRAIEVMKRDEIFGAVELQNVWRSHLCDLAQKM